MESWFYNQGDNDNFYDNNIHVFMLWHILNTVPLLPRIIWMSATKDNVLRRDMNDSVGLRPHCIWQLHVYKLNA